MGTRIALVRHGETDWNAEKRLQGQTDIPLNDAGRDQAHAAGRELLRTVYDGGAWDVLVSSPLGRAVETAAIVGGQLGLEAIAPVEGLQERHYGGGEGRVVEGMGRAELDQLLATAEPEAEVVHRAQTALRGTVAAYPEANIVVVAHGTLIRLLVGSLLDLRHPRVLNGEVVELDADLLGAPGPVDVPWPPDVEVLAGGAPRPGAAPVAG